jgi:hypothetical protein
MSDYLWDKTGARDAEVERLENLLGQLRHSPRPLALPDELTTMRAQAGPHALTARRRLRTRWLAFAATLLLAFVALALALLRTGANGGNGQTASQVSLENSRRGRQQSTGNQPQNVERQADASPNRDAAQSNQDDVTVAGVPQKRDVQVIANAVTKENRKERQLAPRERQPVFVARREQPQQTRINASGVTRASQPSSPDDLPLATRLAAKEQLVYALRLTSSKLSEVRAKTLGLGDAKRGFVEGNPIR